MPTYALRLMNMYEHGCLDTLRTWTIRASDMAEAVRDGEGWAKLCWAVEGKYEEIVFKLRANDSSDLQERSWLVGPSVIILTVRLQEVE